MVTRADGLLGSLRSKVSQLLAPPQVRPQSPIIRQVRPPEPPRDRPEQYAAQDVLAGVCNGIALRDLNLVDTLLAELERMEAVEQDPDELSMLYRLDHLATRLRRNAENLRVLSGRETADDHGADTQHLVNVIRAGMSAIEQYPRVTIGRVVSLGVVGFAADDLGRLLAELLDNATNSSPPPSPVRVSAHLTEQGSVLLRIEDEGIGLPPERLAGLNARLTTAPVLDRKAVQHMGLAVVGRLAHRHRMRVRLERRTPNGTIATVLIPTPLVCDLPETSWSGGQTVGYPARYQATRSVDGLDVAPDTGTPSSADAAPAGTPPEGAAVDSSPAVATETGAHTVNGLPRRRPADPTPSSADVAEVADTVVAPPTSTPPMPSSADVAPTESSTSDIPGEVSVEPSPTADSVAARPDPVASAGRTTNGLPRRVPTSLRNPGTSRKLEPPRAFHELADRHPAEPDHAGLLADLTAFTDGERAAREDRSRAESQSAGGHPTMGDQDGGTTPTGAAPQHERDHEPTSEDSSDA